MERGEAVILRGAHVQLSLAETREKEEMEGQGAGFEAPSRGFKSYVKRSSSARWAGVDHPPSSSLRRPEGPATLLGSPSTTAITCDAVVE